MQQRPLGTTGLTVSALGYGAGNVGGLMVRGTHEQQVAAVKRALDAGITYFDTAPLYGYGLSDQHLGAVLTELAAWGRVAVGTKVRLSADDLRDPAAAVRKSITESLRRLGRDSVDLLQLHNNIRATSNAANPGLGPDDLAAAADAIQAVVKQGLAAHAGFTGVGDTEPLHGAAPAVASRPCSPTSTRSTPARATPARLAVHRTRPASLTSRRRRALASSRSASWQAAP